MTKRKFRIGLTLTLVLLICLTTMSIIVLTQAAEPDYFYGIGISVKEEGYGNGFIRSSDVSKIKNDETRTYLADKIIYYTQDNLPEYVEINLEDLQGHSAYVSYNGESYPVATNGAVARLQPTSATLSFDVVITTSGGLSLQKMSVNVGFIKIKTTNSAGSDEDAAYNPLFDSGEGTKTNPFVIKTAEHLDNMRLFMNSHFVLVNDIDLAEYKCKNNDFFPNAATDNNWRGIGYGENYSFGGSLKGKPGDAASSFKIKNLKLLNSSFITYASNAEIAGVDFENATLTANSTTSAILASAKDTIFKDISVTGSLTSTVTGSAPFVTNAVYTDACKNKTVVENINIAVNIQNPNYLPVGGAFYRITGPASENDGFMTGIEIDAASENHVIMTGIEIEASSGFNVGDSISGGIAGRASNVIIENSKFTGKLNAGQGTAYTGGFIGYAENIIIGDDCEAQISFVAKQGTPSNYNGGLIGYSPTDVTIGENVVVKGSISLGSGASIIGGMVGYIEGKTTIKDYCEVELDILSGAGQLGGLAGRSNKGLIVGDSVVVDINKIRGTGEYLGGLMGYISAAQTTALEAGDNLTLNVDLIEGAAYVGGLYGYAKNVTVKIGNNAKAAVTAIKSTGNYAGAAVGAFNDGLTTLNLFETGSDFILDVGSVTGASYIGGFAGQFNGSIDGIILDVDVYASGSYAGGFAGQFNGDAKNCIISGTVAAVSYYAGGFAGTFQGDGDNIEIAATISAYQYMGGFTGSMSASSSKNTTLTDTTIKNGTYINGTASGYASGGIAGQMTATYNSAENVTRICVVENALVEKGVVLKTAEVHNVNYVGGIVGYMTNAQMTESTTYLDITASQFMGGLVGRADAGDLGSNNKVYGNVTSIFSNNGSGHGYIGGFAGYMASGTVGSYNIVKSDITVANPNSAEFLSLGGFIGETGVNTTIGGYNSYSGTILSVNQRIGGFIGASYGDVGYGNKVDAVMKPVSGARIGLFAGSIFSGKIQKFYISDNSQIITASATTFGIFGTIEGGEVGGTVGDELIIKTSFTAQYSVGAFTSSMSGGKVSNVIAYGSVSTTYLGGAAGLIYDMSGGTLENCVVMESATIYSHRYTSGGLVGQANFTTNNGEDRIINCKAYNSVYIYDEVQGNGNSYGGFIGALSNGNIGSDCASYGDVIISGGPYQVRAGGFVGTLGAGAKIHSGTKAYGNVNVNSVSNGNYGYAGGFAGINSGEIGEGCISYGSVTSYLDRIGGFVGYNSGTIKGNCLAYGEIIALPQSAQNTSHVGGFVGEMVGGSIEFLTSKYMGSFVSGARVGGFAGVISGGTFDGGDGYYNSYINVKGTSGAGGFTYYLDGTAVLKNIRVYGTVTSDGNAGGLVCVMAKGKIENCIAETSATVYAVSYAGGLVSYGNAVSNSGTTDIINCAARNDVYSSYTPYADKLIALTGNINADTASYDNAIGTIYTNTAAGITNLTVYNTDTVANITNTTQHVTLNDSWNINYILTGTVTGSDKVTAAVLSGTAIINNITDLSCTVNFTKSGTVTIRFIFNDDSTVFKDVIFIVKLPAPTAASINTAYNFGEWTNESVAISAGIIPAGLKLQYAYADTWYDVGSGFTVSTNGIYNLRLRYVEIDKAVGAADVVSAEFSAGTIKIEIASELTKEEVDALVLWHKTSNGKVFTLGKIDSISGVTYKYIITTDTAGALTDYTGSVLVESGSSVQFFVQRGIDDTAVASSSFEVAGIVVVPLEFTVQAKAGTDNYISGSWTTEDVIFYFSTNSAESGLTYRYRIWNTETQSWGGWTKTNAVFYKISISTNATYQFALFDVNGDILTEAPAYEYVVKTDKSSPVIASPAVPSASEATMVEGYSFTINITITGLPYSRISGVTVVDPKGDEHILTDLAYDTTFVKNFTILKAFGNGTYTIMMTDNAGRTFTRTFYVDCFKEGADNDFAYVSGNPADWATEARLVFQTSSKNIKLFEYSFNEGNFVTVSNGIDASGAVTYLYFTATNNGTYRFRVTDYNNVVIDLSEAIVVSKVDNLTPSLFLEYNSESWVVGEEAVKITTSVGISNIKSLTVTLNGVTEVITGATTYAVKARGIYTFTLTSNSGAFVQQTLNITLIDSNYELTLKVELSPEDEAKLGDWTKDEIRFNLSVVQSIIVPLTYYYSTDGGKNWTAIAGTSYIARGNINKPYIFKAETVSGLVAYSDLNNPYKVMVDSYAPVLEIDSKWESNRVVFTITSKNTVCDYTLWYKNEIDAEWTKVTGYAVTLSFASGDAYPNYVFKIITELGLESENSYIKVAQDEGNPLIGIIETGKFGDWTNSVTFTIFNSTNQTSGTTFQYRIRNADGSYVDGNINDGWKTINAYETYVSSVQLIVDYTVNGWFEFRAISGAGRYASNGINGIIESSRKVMIDKFASVKIDDISLGYTALGYTMDKVTLDIEFMHGGSGLSSMYVKLPGGNTQTLSGKTTFVIYENGTYQFYVTNGMGITGHVTYVVDKIDTTTPDFFVTATNSEIAWMSGVVSFSVTSRNNPRSGIYYYYKVGNNGAEIYFEDSFQLSGNINTVVQIIARTGAGKEAVYSRTVMLDNLVPSIEIKISEAAAISNVVFDITTLFGLSGGAAWVEVNGVASMINGSVYQITQEGTYIFYALSGTGIRSETITKNIIFPKIMGSVSGKEYTAEQMSGATYKSNVELTATAGTYARIEVYKDLALYSADFKGGVEKFTKNGTYEVIFYGLDGSITTITFIVNKPNYVLIFSMIGLGILVAAVITVLLIMNIRNKRALKRLIAASTVTDENNKFLMFKKIK